MKYCVSGRQRKNILEKADEIKILYKDNERLIDYIKEFKDSDTVIGNIITTSTGMTVIPISKITVGLATGGVDYTPKKVRSEFTFGGGGGTVASISPSAFLIITKDNDVKLLNLNERPGGVERVADLIEKAPDVIERIKRSINKNV